MFDHRFLCIRSAYFRTRGATAGKRCYYARRGYFTYFITALVGYVQITCCIQRYAARSRKTGRCTRTIS